MRRRRGSSLALRLASGGALCLLLACGDGAEPTSDPSAADVREQASEAVDAARDYAAAQRSQLAERGREALSQVERDLESARRAFGEQAEEARRDLEPAIERAEAAQRALADELEALSETGAGWDETRERFSTVMQELEEARREVGDALSGDARGDGEIASERAEGADR